MGHYGKDLPSAILLKYLTGRFKGVGCVCHVIDKNSNLYVIL